MTLPGEELRVLAEEHAALRRVATLVARGIPQEELFAAVTEAVGQLLPVEFAIMGRYEDDDTVTCVAAWGAPAGRFRVGSRSTLEGNNLVTIVLKTGSPARVDHFAHASGPIGVVGRQSGFHSAVGTPIVVDGRLWGVMTVGSTLTKPPLPADTEARLASFTELVPTAVANAESRAGLERLAEEQAALRRVATLVAGGAAPDVVFATVTEEVGRLLPVDFADLSRYESDGTITMLATWGITHAVLPAGARLRLGGKNLSTVVAETGASARIESYDDASGPIGAAVRKAGVRSVVGTPIIVDGRLWGMVAAGSTIDKPLPADAEARLASFTELLATAIANAESRGELARLAEEVGELGAGEPLAGLPAMAYPAQITVQRRASRSALVGFEANEYSVPPVHAGRKVTVIARIGEPLLRIVSAAGGIVAEHRRAPRGAGQTIRTTEHARQLETAVLVAFTTEQACRRKPNLPPGENALTELARLRGLPAEQTAVVVSLADYAALAQVAR